MKKSEIFKIALIFISVCTILILTCLKVGNDNGYKAGWEAGYKYGNNEGENRGFNIAIDTMTKIATNQIKSFTTVSKVVAITKDTIVFNLSAKTCLKHAEPAR